MFKYIIFFIATNTLFSMAMERNISAEALMKEMVAEYTPKIKPDTYRRYSGSFLPTDIPTNVSSAPSEFLDMIIKKEVTAGTFYHDLFTNQGILCADNKIFIGDLVKKKITSFLNIPGRIDPADNKRMAVTAVMYARIMGVEEKAILLGEDGGRVLIANPKDRSIKTFGSVNGRILSFSCHPEGSQIAVRYASTNAAGLVVPCVGLSVAFLKSQLSQSKSPRRFSWAPAGPWEWSNFAWKPCEHEVKNISFEGNCCVTECATGAIEKWKVENVDTNPNLVKVE